MSFDAKGHQRRRARRDHKRAAEQRGLPWSPEACAREERAAKHGSRIPGAPATEYGAEIDRLVAQVVRGVHQSNADKRAEIERLEAIELARPAVELVPGTRVRLRAKTLVAFGYGKTGDGETIAGVWTIVACSCDLCALGRHICVDEFSELYGRPRHFARAAVLPLGELERPS